MSKKLQRALRETLKAPTPTRKTAFFRRFPYPKATPLEFALCQAAYIRKRFWSLSVLLFIGMVVGSVQLMPGDEIVGTVSAILPLLTVISITELSKSVSCNMTELEMSCKYDLGKITLIRLAIISGFHFVILLLSLLWFREQTQYDLFRYALYTVTPFLLSSYLSFWITNHITSKDSSMICSGVTAVLITAVFILNTKHPLIYGGEYLLFWSAAFLVIFVLLVKEIHFLLKGRMETWSFA